MLTRSRPSMSPAAGSLVAPKHKGLARGHTRGGHRPLRCRAELDETTMSVSAAELASHELIEAARLAAEHSFSETYAYVPADERLEEDDVSQMRRKLEAIGRELSSVTEAEYRSLSPRMPSSPRHQKQQIGSAASVTITLPGSAAPTPPPTPTPVAPPAGEVMQNIVPLTPRLQPVETPREEEERSSSSGSSKVDDGKPKPEGHGHEILLQGFNWESWKHNWFENMTHKAQEIADMGFTAVWLPPFTDSVSEQGYMPRDLYNLNSKYGSEEQLIRCVRALQSHGIKVLGDAVLNHRCAQFQDETGKWNKFGGKLSWDQRAIVGDQHEYGGRGNRSSGDTFGAAPNIDHSQAFVKRDLCEWMQWLRNHVGFDGWRLDFVKGFHGSHVKDYVEASVPEFVVGEYWDTLDYGWDGTPSHNQDAHRQRLVNWINAAGGLATAFDITTKGIMHAVFERCEYWRLKDTAGKPPGLLGWWPSRSVTFLENHDTGSTQGHWRFPNHALEQGYCYILTHPGTPTVFYDHIFSGDNLPHVIKRLIDIRNRAGIHARSQVKIVLAERDVYAAEIDGKLLMKIGPGDFKPDKSVYGIGRAFASSTSGSGTSTTPAAAAAQHGAVDCGHCWAIWEKKQ